MHKGCISSTNSCNRFTTSSSTSYGSKRGSSSPNYRRGGTSSSTNSTKCNSTISAPASQAAPDAAPATEFVSLFRHGG